MRTNPKLTQAQKLDDSLADAEIFMRSTIGELSETMTHLKGAQLQIRICRLTLARMMKKLSSG